MQEYCIDTSSLLEAWVRHYPPDVFVGFWEDLDTLIAQGRLVAPEEVGEEISKKDDGLSSWADSRPELFIPFDPIQESALIEILTDHELLMKNSKRKNAADPFVIALAKTKDICVVSEEHNGSERKPRIPDVCASLGMHCYSIVEVMRLEGWSYRLP